MFDALQKLLNETTIEYMTTDQLLQKIGELFTNHTALIRKEIKDSAEDVKKELRAEFKKAIERSQEETIEVLTDVINEGHNLHEKRIKRIEKHLDLPPIQ